MSAAGDRGVGPPTGSRATDDRYRNQGQLILTRLHGLIRVSRSYEVGNQVFRQQLELFLGALDPVFADSEEAVLVSLDDDLYLNGVRIPIRSNNLRFHQAILEELRRRRIAGIRIASGVTVDEMERFFSYFTQPDSYHGTGLLEAVLAAGVDRIAPAVHASTEAPSYDDLPEEEEGEEENDAPWVVATSPEEQLRAGPDEPAAGHGGIHSGAVRKNYSVAMQGTRSLLTTTSLQSGMEVRRAKRVVQPLVDGAFDSEPVVVGLATLGDHDEYTYAHSVNVCMVAVTMGHFLQLDRRALADLGVAALLHDVGKAGVADLIHHPLESFDPDERAAAERHPLEGAKLIARSTALNPTTLRCMRVALEHHMNPDGTGYPNVAERWAVSLLSRLIAVADCYVSLLMHRSESGRDVTPYDALGMMLGPLHTKFDPGLLWALVQTVGFYPPGQMVELDDHRLAVVVAPNPDDLARPHVRVLYGAKGDRVEVDVPIEYRPLPPGMSVLRALKAGEYPSDERPARAA